MKDFTDSLIESYYGNAKDNFNYYKALEKQDLHHFSLEHINDLLAHYFGDKDYNNLEDAINSLFSQAKDMLPFPDFIEMLDSDCRAKDYEFIGNDLYYYIEGFSEDYD